MVRFLIAISTLFVLGGVFFAWTSVSAARRERDQALMAVIEAQARARSAQADAHAAATDSGALEKPPAAASEQRVAVPSPEHDDHQVQELIARVASLEKEIHDLRERVDGRAAVETYDTPEAIAKALQQQGSTLLDTQRRIELLEHFLKLFPTHADAAVGLELLVGAYLQSKPALALDALDRYGTTVITDASRLDHLRAGALVQNQRFDDGRAAYERVLSAATDPHGTADATFWISYSYMQETRYDEAQSRFENLIASYEKDPSPGMSNIVEGAKNQLKLIAEYKAKK